jgi:LPXTG-motif cell wall-anchored protein
MAVGSVAITKTDPTGTRLEGAAFLLLDVTGQEAANGRTDAQGQLTLAELPAGVYRLRETASGSPQHDTVADQDVIVTPGGTTRLTTVDPFKQAHLTLQVKDDKTGKPLSGARVNIGSADTTLLTLTTGSKGTASADLPITSLTTRFWAKQTKAPASYQLPKTAKTFTAGPAAQVTVTFNNSKIPAEPRPPTDGLPTAQPTDTATSDKDTGNTQQSDENRSARSETSATSAVSPSTSEKSSKPLTGTLAHTGADSNRWLLGAAAGLLAIGAGSAYAARRHRRRDDSEPATD